MNLRLVRHSSSFVDVGQAQRPNNLQTQLTDNVVTNLQTQIDALRGDVDEVESSVTSLTTRTTELEGKSGKVLDADTGELVTLHSDPMGVLLYSGNVTPSSAYTFHTIVGYVYDDDTNYMYAFDQEDTSISVFRGTVNTDGSAVLSKSGMPILSNVTRNSSDCGILRIYGYSPKNALVKIGDSNNSSYDIVYNRFQGASNATTNYIVGLYTETRSPYGMSVNYLTRSTSGSSLSVFIQQYTRSRYILGAAGDTLYISAESYYSPTESSDYTIKLDLNTKSVTIGFLLLNQYNSNPIGITPIYSDETHIYLFAYTKSGTAGNRILIYDMQTGTSNIGSIAFNASIPISHMITNGSINMIHYIGNIGTYSYFIAANYLNDADSCIVRFNVSSGEWAAKSLTNNTSRTFSEFSSYQYKVMIDPGALIDGEYIPFDGVLVSWDKGEMILPFGVRSDNYVMVGKSTMSNVLYPYYPKYVMNRISNMYNRAGNSNGYLYNIFGDSIVHTSSSLKKPYAAFFDGKIGGKQFARIYTNFKYV